MSRLLLIVGMIVSLAVPVGFVACAAATPEQNSTSSSASQSSSVVAAASSQGGDGSTSQPPDAQTQEDPGIAAQKAVHRHLDSLRRLVAIKKPRRYDAGVARALATLFRDDAKALKGRAKWRVVALRGAAAADALGDLYADETYEHYLDFESARKALNRAF